MFLLTRVVARNLANLRNHSLRSGGILTENVVKLMVLRLGVGRGIPVESCIYGACVDGSSRGQICTLAWRAHDTMQQQDQGGDLAGSLMLKFSFELGLTSFVCFWLLNEAARDMLTSLPALSVSKWLISSVSLLGVMESAIFGV